jgi:hypothetical protein
MERILTECTDLTSASGSLPRRSATMKLPAASTAILTSAVAPLPRRSVSARSRYTCLRSRRRRFAVHLSLIFPLSARASCTWKGCGESARAATTLSISHRRATAASWEAFDKEDYVIDSHPGSLDSSFEGLAELADEARDPPNSCGVISQLGRFAVALRTDAQLAKLNHRHFAMLRGR